MSYLTPRRGRPVAAAALSLLCLLVVAAPAARADGEDDPTFGNVGTSFVALGEFAPLGDQNTGGPMRPRTDQAPDGAVVSAVPIHPDPLTTRGDDDDVLRVVRMDGSGKPAGLDGDGIVDVRYPRIDNLLDIEALGDGRILLVTQSSSGAGRGGSRPVEIRTLNGSGQEVGDGNEFFPPDDCDNTNGDPIAADVDALGRIFVGWENCKGEAVLARYDGANELTRVMPVDGVTEVTLGPDSLVYVLSYEPGFNKQRGIFDGSLVTRYETSNLDLDGDYGDEGVAEIGQTFPVDFTVGPNGNAVVWGNPVRFLRGSGPDTWDFYRLDDDGELDDSWGDEGHAEISHPALGFEFSNTCSGRGRFCGSERPQVIAQGDNKIIAIGYPPEEQEQTPPRGPEAQPEEIDRTIIRLTDAGALDPSWDGDGVRSFTLTQPAGGSAEYITLGPPALQSDGKLLIPLFTQAGQTESRVPAPPDGTGFGVSRIGLTPPGTPAAPQQQAASSAVVVPARSCVSRRVFRIRLRTGRRKAERSAIKTVRVTVNGKNVPVSSGARRTAQVNLRNLPKGRFTVVIRMTLADGGKVRDTRRYRTCTPKQARELPGLRTRRPRR